MRGDLNGSKKAAFVAPAASIGLGPVVAQPLPAGNKAQPGAAVPQMPQMAKPSSGGYRRDLPHLQREGATLFVTFCTAGQWQLPPSVRSEVLRHCLHDHKVKVQVHGVVVMPDHVHIVFTPLTDSAGKTFSLAEIMNGIKGSSAHAVNRLLSRRGHVWQDESFDHILRSDESTGQKVEYVCQNPARKGIVQAGETYPWLWREWIEGEENAQSRAAVPRTLTVAQPPSAGDKAQPGAAVPQTNGDTAQITPEGGCAT